MSHRFIYLNAWSPVHGTIWEGLGGVAFLEDVCHSSVDFGVSKTQPVPVSLSLFLLSADPDVELSATSPVPCLPACPHASHHGLNH